MTKIKYKRTYFLYHSSINGISNQPQRGWKLCNNLTKHIAIHPSGEEFDLGYRTDWQSFNIIINKVIIDECVIVRYKSKSSTYSNMLINTSHPVFIKIQEKMKAEQPTDP